jgi:hypothetical protein
VHPELTAWLVAFLFTQVVEVPIYVIPLTRVSNEAAQGGGRATGILARLCYAFLPSLVTHPVVWFAFPHLPLPYVPMVVCAEAFAILVEGVILRFFAVDYALFWSLGANLTSVALGFASRAAFGWP